MTVLTASRFRCALLIAILVPTSVRAQQGGYVVSQTLRLTTSANGVSGKLEVLLDSRLTSELQKKMWGVGDWAFFLSESDRQYALFKAKPPNNAQLRIVNDGAEVQQTVTLDKPLARVSEAHLIDDRTSFLIAVDYSVGFGSYAGVTTQLLDVADGQLRWADAKAVDTGEIERIQLPSTLKSAWKLVPFRGNRDILLVYCRPAKVQVAGREFVVGYMRYRFDGTQWLKYERQRNGFWESDEPFPPLASFP